jgi:hypothetical protein
VNEERPIRAAFARDAALARLRRTTRAAVAVSVALAGIFAGIAAASTHPRKVVYSSGRRLARPKETTVTPTTTAASTTTVNPGDEEATPTTTVAPAPPVQAPVPATSPPVVVSGGS